MSTSDQNDPLTSEESPHEIGQKKVSLSEAFGVWLRIGLLSFGGPAAQIALMHKSIVEEKRWMTEDQYLGGLSFCMLLPGPEAMQLATYAGWRLNGLIGGLMAGLLFVLPGALVIAVLALIYALYGNADILSGVFLGVKACVIIIVVEALLRVAKKALHGMDHWVIAAIAFLGIFFFNVPYPLIVLVAAIYGWFSGMGKVNNSDTLTATSSNSIISKRQITSTVTTTAVWLIIWCLPFLLLIPAGNDFLVQLGAFFSKLAVVTFGGAYAVLAYLTQDVVTEFQWLTTGEMMDGLGLAETTPGPLILVTEFVGFLAGYKQGGIALALAATLVTLWVTFVPCFLWIFAGAPYIEMISRQPALRGALAAITAAVVGVILNLSVWFALHVVFGRVNSVDSGVLRTVVPDWSSIDWRVVVLAIISAVLLLGMHWSVVRVLFVMAVLGLGASML